MSWSRDEVSVLIDEYRKWPNLYKVKSVNYKNRNLRKEALEHIVGVLKSVKPNVTEADCQQKFQALKQNAIKERKKKEISLKSGAGSEEIYEPSLWYYEAISFVFDHVVPRMSFDSLSVDVEVLDEANTSDSQCFLSPEFNEDSENVLCGTISTDGEVVLESPLTPTVKSTPSTSTKRTIGTMSPTSIDERAPSKKMKKTDDRKFFETVTGNLKDLTAKLGDSPAVEVPQREKTPNEVFGDYIVGKLNRIDVEEIRDEVEEKIISELNCALRKCREHHN